MSHSSSYEKALSDEGFYQFDEHVAVLSNEILTESSKRMMHEWT